MTQEISISGFWLAAWLFGYAKLGFLHGLLAIVLSPYVLGSTLAH
jgi:hypothetical protein